MKRLAPLLLALLVAAACGSSGPDERLVAAQHSLVAAHDGKLHVEVTTGTAHYEVDGPFSYSDPSGNAVLELTYTHAHGKDTSSTKVIATGKAGFVRQGSVLQPMSADQLGSLRYQGDGSGAVPDLHIDEWQDDTDVLVGDLAALAADMEGRKPGAVGDLGKVAHHDVVVKTGKDDAFRSLHAEVDFASVTPALRQALGDDAGTHLEVDVTLGSIDLPLEVESPVGD